MRAVEELSAHSLEETVASELRASGGEKELFHIHYNPQSPALCPSCGTGPCGKHNLPFMYTKNAWQLNEQISVRVLVR